MIRKKARKLKALRQQVLKIKKDINLLGVTLQKLNKALKANKPCNRVIPGLRSGDGYLDPVKENKL